MKNLKELMYDDKIENIIESYYVFGEIKAIQEKNRLKVQIYGGPVQSTGVLNTF